MMQPKVFMSVMRSTSLSVLVMIAGCAGSPPSPDWEIDAEKALKRGATAYLEGRERVESSEFSLATREVARTGRADLLARVALTRCASEVASLVFNDCATFEKLRADAPPAERSYADYLLGKSGDAALLPPLHRGVAVATNDASAAEAVKIIADPMSRMIAAGVVFRRNQASPALIDVAIETASAQGWRKPLLAWLGVKLKRAEAANEKVLVEQIQRRIKLIENAVMPETARQ
jgi:hypothetical protein